MLNKAKIALAAAVVFGSASAALAGEGSADLSYPPGYNNAAPQRVYSTPRNSARDAFASTRPQWGASAQGRRGFSAQEKALFDLKSGGINNN